MGIRSTLLRHDGFFELLPDLLSIVAFDGTILDVNRNWETLLGLPPDSLKSRDLFGHVHPNDHASLRDHVRRLQEGTEPARFEVRFRDGGGLYRWLQWAAMGDPKTGVFYAIAADVTERKKIEAALAERVRQAGVLNEIGRSAMAAEDLGLFLNEAVVYVAHSLQSDLCEVLAVSPAGLRRIAGVGWPSGATEIPIRGAQTDYVLSRREPIVLEDSASENRFTVFHHLQAQRVVSGGCITLRGTSEPYGLLGVYFRQHRAMAPDDLRFLQSVADVVGLAIQRDRAVSDLRSSEARFRTLVDSMDDFVFTLGPDQRFTAVYGRRIGHDDLVPERFLGKKAAEILGPEAAKPHEEAERKALTGTPVTYEWPLPTAGGPRHILNTLSPMTDARGTVVGIVGIGRDITDLRGEERRRSRIEEQLRQVQKLEAIGRLAGGIAHDFNNTLTVILGYANLLNEWLAGDPKLGPMLAQILTAAGKAGALTKRLLAFSRKQTPVPQVVLLPAVVEAMLGMLRPLLTEEIDIDVRSEPDVPPVLVDAAQIEQVLMNLAANARDAMPHGGRLVIECGKVPHSGTWPLGVPMGRYVHLTASDTGTGMGPETLSHVFEPFFTTKEPGKGTGLGLASVHGIVKQNRGHIWVDSAPGKGTSFRMWFPACESPAPASRTPTPPPMRPRPGAETVLLVEDDPSVRSLVSLGLREEGYRVLEVEGPHLAIGVLERHAGPIHLLLSDVIMPGMTGPELAEKLLQLRPDLKVLFMSGYTGSAFVRVGATKPVDVKLRKPFAREDLLRVVREVLG